MAITTNRFIAPYAPSIDVRRMSPDERIDAAIGAARTRNRDPSFEGPLCAASPLADETVARLEDQLGLALPREYRSFIARFGWLHLVDGWQVAGIMPEGQRIGEHEPWLSHEHRPPDRHLVIGAFCAFADGDQLLIDLADPDGPVIAYLHAHGPAFEAFAPSFSFALHRLVTDDSLGLAGTD